MKKTIALLTALLIFSASLAFAAGDKNRHRHQGDKGKGSTYRHQVAKP